MFQFQSFSLTVKSFFPSLKDTQNNSADAQCSLPDATDVFCGFLDMELLWYAKISDHTFQFFGIELIIPPAHSTANNEIL